MINLRYHIVSLVAVFLALALGMLVGSTLLREGSVQALRFTSDQLIKQTELYREQNNELEAEVARFEEFGTAVLPAVVAGRLEDQPVVLLDTGRVGDGARQRVTEALRAAGAQVDGRVTLSEERLALGDDGDREVLAELVSSDPGDPAALRQALVSALVERLLSPAALPTGDDAPQGGLLTALRDANLLADLEVEPPVADGKQAFPRQGSVFVIIGPAEGGGPLAPEALLVPLAERLGAANGVVTVAVEVSEGDSSWLQVLRADGDAAGRVSTVDGVDRVYGQYALVEALARRLAGEPPAHFGSKAGSDELLPGEGAP